MSSIAFLASAGGAGAAAGFEITKSHLAAIAGIPYDGIQIATAIALNGARLILVSYSAGVSLVSLVGKRAPFS